AGAPAVAAGGAQANPARDDARPDVAAVHVLLDPPAEQRGEVLAGRRGRPVELWREVIDPALGEPAARIRVDQRVRVEAADPGRVVRSPDPERADPEPDVRLLSPDLATEPLHERIHVGAPPVRAVEPPAGCNVRGVA